MKAFLMILVIILTGLVFAVRHYSTRPTEAHRAVIAELMEDLEGSEFERDRLAAELARAKAALGWRPAYPAYREGLRAILAAESAATS
jgi:nucleoside-diphosphate-sugar epimerase